MITDEPATTLAESLRLQIADDIVRNILPLNAALDETKMARRFNVSRTPVREALRQLAASGLVETKPHRSALVTHPNVEQLHAMFETMAELEATCAALAAERMTIAERDRLKTFHGQLRLVCCTGDPEQFHEINELFHSTIYIGTHNTYLGESTLSARERVRPFRRAQLRNAGRLHKSQAEHDRVVQAILKGDCAGATMAMRDHINVVRSEYENYAGFLAQG